MMNRTSAVAIVFATAVLTSTLSLVARQELPEGEGRDLTLQLCAGECHGIEKVVGERKSKSQWAETMIVMRNDGSKGTDEEFKIITTYMTTHFGVQVRINKATAKQIDDVLVLADGLADAIVKYRDANGPFATWDDLMKVPGLDAKVLVVQKAKVVF